MRPHRGTCAVLICCGLSATLLGGCSTGTPRQTKLLKTTKMTISSAQLRVQVRSMAGRFSGLMEQAGDRALRQTDDPATKRAVLMWLTNGIPAMQQALFQPDPLAALIDALRARFPALCPVADRAVYLVNARRATPETPLSNGDRVLVMQLLGGG